MTMYKVGTYLPSDSMSNLICDNYQMLLVMSRFGIDLGFGEDTIEEVCSKHNVDTYTFLAVVNILIASDRRHLNIDYTKVSLPSLVKYLHKSHSYYLDYRFPSIRKKLIEVIDRKDDLSVVIVNYYDEYFAEVRKHMMYEEERLFPYIEAMVNGVRDEEYNINIYSEHHDKVEAKLSEFKNIIIKYYPAKTTYELNNVLHDIFACEGELGSHNNVENYLLVPTMKRFESLKEE